MSNGIAVDAWVTVDDDCRVVCEVIGDQAQFRLGHSSGSLHLVVTEAGLAKLATVATDALVRLQAIPEGAEVCFAVQSEVSNTGGFVPIDEATDRTVGIGMGTHGPTT